MTSPTPSREPSTASKPHGLVESGVEGRQEWEKRSEGERFVWLVIYDNYGDTWLSEIFDSEEKALAYEEERDPAADRRYVWQKDYRIEKRVVR